MTRSLRELLDLLRRLALTAVSRVIDSAGSGVACRWI